MTVPTISTGVFAFNTGNFGSRGAGVDRGFWASPIEQHNSRAVMKRNAWRRPIGFRFAESNFGAYCRQRQYGSKISRSVGLRRSHTEKRNIEKWPTRNLTH